MKDFTSDEFYMREALRMARRAFASDEVPIGAVVVRDSEIIARAWNQVETLKDPTAMRNACHHAS
jgi:tRNA(adenine34) deaminase